MPSADRSSQTRRKETLDACHKIHGGSENENGPSLDGMWATLVNVATPERLSNYISNSSKITKHVLLKIINNHVKEFEKSQSNILRSVAVLYNSKGLLSKEQYK